MFAQGKIGEFFLSSGGLVGNWSDQPPHPTSGSKGALVEPRQADLRDGAGSPANDYACVARQCHEKVPCVTHPARHYHCRWPLGPWHLIWRDDAQHGASACHRPLGSDAGSWTAAATDDCDAKACEQRTCLTGEVICVRARFGAAEHADLRAADRHQRRSPCAAQRGLVVRALSQHALR